MDWLHWLLLSLVVVLSIVGLVASIRLDEQEARNAALVAGISGYVDLMERMSSMCNELYAENDHLHNENHRLLAEDNHDDI